MSLVQRRRVLHVLQGFLAVYHPEVPVAWFRDCKINAARAEKLYVAYCQKALPLTHSLNDSTLVHLAWAIREQQQSREGHFLPHAQRYLEELKDLLCGANTSEKNALLSVLVDPAPLPPE